MYIVYNIHSLKYICNNVLKQNRKINSILLINSNLGQSNIISCGSLSIITKLFSNVLLRDKCKFLHMNDIFRAAKIFLFTYLHHRLVAPTPSQDLVRL